MRRLASIPFYIGIMTSFFLLWALYNPSYGYYTLLRWITFSVSFYFAYLSYSFQPKGWSYTFLIIALLFNPIIPVKLDRSIWKFVDIAVAIYMVVVVSIYEPLKGRK